QCLRSSLGSTIGGIAKKSHIWQKAEKKQRRFRRVCFLASSQALSCQIIGVITQATLGLCRKAPPWFAWESMILARVLLESLTGWFSRSAASGCGKARNSPP